MIVEGTPTKSTAKRVAATLPIHRFPEPANADRRTRHLARALNTLFADAPSSNLCERPMCRLGSSGDGGWPVCIDSNHLRPGKGPRRFYYGSNNTHNLPTARVQCLLLRARLCACYWRTGKSCVIYSVGISTKPEFDLGALPLHCEQHMLDHTVSDRLQRRYNEIGSKVHFHPLGLAARSDPSQSLTSLPDLMARHGHTAIDVLKIDCEVRPRTYIAHSLPAHHLARLMAARCWMRDRSRRDVSGACLRSWPTARRRCWHLWISCWLRCMPPQPRAPERANRGRACHSASSRSSRLSTTSSDGMGFVWHRAISTRGASA